MSNITNQTWGDLRVSIGRLLRVVKLITAATNGSTTTFVTDDLPVGQTDDFNGKWLAFTGPSNNDGTSQQVTASAESSNRITLTTFPAVTSTTTSDTAELWDEDYDPVHLLGLAKQAVIDATSYVFDPTTDDSLHTGGAFRFDIPATFEMLTDVFVRTSMNSQQVLESGSVWDESVDADFTVVDEESKSGSSDD